MHTNLEETLRGRAPRDEDEDGRGWRGRKARAGRDAARPGAGESADADEYQPPSPDDCGDGTEDYRSGRKWRPPPSSTPPCNPRGKPAHPPPLHPYRAPLSLDPRPPPPPTNCSPPDDCSGPAAKVTSRCSPSSSAPVIPTRCRFARNCNLRNPPPETHNSPSC